MSRPQQKSTLGQKFARLFGIGLFMGSADLVPGVSGGTIAFLMGIYEELIESIRILTGKTIQLLLKGRISQAYKSIPLPFLLPLGLGIASAIFLLSTPMTVALDRYPTLLFSVFFGLVSASAIVVSRRIQGWGKKEIVSLLSGATLLFIIVGLAPSELAASPGVFFFTGIIAFSAMILPGISGSLVMLIIGSYSAVIAAVSARELGLLLFLIMGGVLGLSLFSRVLHKALESYHSITIAFLVGLMVGSLRKVWPWKSSTSADSSIGSDYLLTNVLPQLNKETALALFLMVAAFLFVLYLSRRGKIRDHGTEDIAGTQK